MTTSTRDTSTTFRFSRLAFDLLARMAEDQGLSKTSYLEQLLRREARQQGLLQPQPPAG